MCVYVFIKLQVRFLEAVYFLFVKSIETYYSCTLVVLYSHNGAGSLKYMASSNTSVIHV